MVKIWFDTEFIDDGKTIELISIGLVREDGAEYYAEVENFDFSNASEWIKENVVANLTGPKKSRKMIAEEVQVFCGSNPEFWCWYGSYDYVALSQLYGTMLSVPDGWPQRFNEILQHADYVFHPYPSPNFRKIFVNESEHNALSDARWNRQVWNFIEKKRR